jgi:dGTPase
LGVGQDKLKYGERSLEQHLLSLIPQKHREAYLFDSQARPDLEPVYRTHLLVDYVAGMTDSHAVKIHRILSGQTSGGVI